jgi:hypothetical protein
MASRWSGPEGGHGPTGHSQIQTTQQYLHTLPLADQEALNAFERIRSHRRD